jgi:hypothetical protein
MLLLSLLLFSDKLMLQNGWLLSLVCYRYCISNIVGTTLYCSWYIILSQYRKDHTKAWSAKIDSFDAFIFVTPEYNHGIPGALKNAIGFLYREWNNKVAGFVSYGGAGGVRSVEQLRLVMAELSC